MTRNLLPPPPSRFSLLQASALPRTAAFVCALGLVAGLNACGGSGSSGNAQRTTSLVLSGTAATGAPIANAEVRFRCNSTTTIVSATATTDASGAYTQTIANAAYPCLLQVTDANGNTLHSYANADGAAHITPLTDAALAAALGQQDLGATFANFDSAQLQALQSAMAKGNPASAWAKIKAHLQAEGVDVSAVANSPFSDALHADAARIHQGHDKLLDDVVIYHQGMFGDALYRMAAGLPVPPVRATGLLNDTGIDLCAENITTSNTWVINAVCSAVNWAANLWGQQQDAFFGRDSQARAGTLTKVGGGMVGFDFTKIGASGKVLAKQGESWSDTGTEAAGTQWDCVRDNVTGLVWEVKRNDDTHLRHKDQTYAWYNPDNSNHGGTVGYKTPQSTISSAPISSTCKGVDSCNTESYVTAVNAAGLCGQKDWRMPTVDELRTLVYTGRATTPLIDTNYFPNTSNNSHWSSSAFATSNMIDSVWGINFSTGKDGYGSKSMAAYVRLVRSRQ